MATFSFEKDGYREYNCPNADAKGNQHPIGKGLSPDEKEDLIRVAVTGASFAVRHVGKKVANQVAEEIVNNQHLRTEAMKHLIVNNQHITKPAIDHYVKTHGHSHASAFVKFIVKLIGG